MNPEPFVPAQEAAKFIGIKPRFLLSLARQGIAGAYPLGTGQVRNTWVFRLSELATAIAGRKPPAREIPNSGKGATIQFRQSPLK